MPALSSYQPYHAASLFERNPLCELCWREVMAMSEEYGGVVRFDLPRSLEKADKLCARLVDEVWQLKGPEFYYHWLEAHLDSKAAVICACVTVCTTICFMQDAPEPLLQLESYLHAYFNDEAMMLFDNLRSQAKYSDISISANSYGAIPPMPEKQTIIDELCLQVDQLKHTIIRKNKQIENMSKRNQPAKHIGYNVEQMTINMSGGTLVQHADLVQASGEVQVTTAEQTVSPTPEKEVPIFCRITDEARRKGVAMDVENELRNACVSAPKLIKAIRTNEALGYLDTQNLNSKELYDLLNAHFGLAFKLRTFQNYRSR